MLRPIPRRILQSVAKVQVCSGIDLYQNQTFDEYTVNRVHVQPVSEVRKSKDNVEYSLNAVLFVDARLSSPRLDWVTLFKGAHDLGGDMIITIRDREYTVMSIDELRDDTDELHHWELGLQ